MELLVHDGQMLRPNKWAGLSKPTGLICNVLAMRGRWCCRQAINVVAPTGPGSGRDSLLLRWRIEDAVDLHDIVVEQTPNLDHRPRRIRRLAPQLCLHLVDHGRKAMQVADVDREPCAILQTGPLRFAISLILRNAWRMRALGSSTNVLVAGSTPCMPATKTKSPALTPRLQVPSALMAPGGLSVFTRLGCDDCALRLAAATSTSTPGSISRRNFGSSVSRKVPPIP